MNSSLDWLWKFSNLGRIFVRRRSTWFTYMLRISLNSTLLVTYFKACPFFLRIVYRLFTNCVTEQLTADVKLNVKNSVFGVRKLHCPLSCTVADGGHSNHLKNR